MPYQTLLDVKSSSLEKKKSTFFPNYTDCLRNIIGHMYQGYDVLDLANDLMNKYSINDEDVSVIIKDMKKKGEDLNNQDEKWLAQVMVKFGIQKL